MKCLLHKIMILLLGGLVPPVIYSALSVANDNSPSTSAICFFYLVGVLCMIRFGIYEEVAQKINSRYKG
ncbi:MAG: hypothetical protein NE328_17130 [Lentisphaeraceae bacterium]|nr:hypothetical protein [Lentisphaeraceae bacterium]